MTFREYGTDYFEEKEYDIESDQDVYDEYASTLLGLIFDADTNTCDYCGNYDTLFAVQGDPLDGESWACFDCRDIRLHPLHPLIEKGK